MDKKSGINETKKVGETIGMDFRVRPGDIIHTYRRDYLFARVSCDACLLIDMFEGNRWSDTPFEGNVKLEKVAEALKVVAVTRSGIRMELKKSKVVIEWDEFGYPTEKSLMELEREVNGKDLKKARDAFYNALGENFYSDAYGSTEVSVRGTKIHVWEYHTYGWDGNEAIIETLKTSWLFDYLLQRYDRGGHYYFDPPEEKNG